MPYFPAANNEPLEKLLAEMFPDVVLSRAGVALLATRISDLDKWSAIIHHRINPKRPRRRREGGAGAMRQRRFS
jgi:hypothetical protein